MTQNPVYTGGALIAYLQAVVDFVTRFVQVEDAKDLLADARKTARRAALRWWHQDVTKVRLERIGPTGQAILTLGYRLPARYVIHTVGPIWQGGGRREHKLLRQAYRSTFQVAREHGDIHSIALPAISTGAYGFPKADAAEIAMSEMTREAPNFDRIVACLFDEESARLYRMLPAATDRQD
jgi:O-acetyl-ADP-ribose deacetylase (regulator of RNase III)